MQTVDYYYCTSCGFEGNNVTVGFSRTTANGDWYHCPECQSENSAEEVEEE